jgi:hypothetical protein
VAIETYASDATGNRTALTTAAGTASYTYPMDSHRQLAVDGEARDHDAAGNTISIGGKAFSYSDANRMSAVKQAGAVVESHTYNHRGERVWRAPVSADAQVTVYDEAGQWIGNYGATGQPQQQAIWLDNYPVALINAPSAGVPEVAYVQPDRLGTPRVVIDPVRDVAIWEWSGKREVFGNRCRTSMRTATVLASSWRCAFRASRRRTLVECSTTTSGTTIRRWGGIRRVIRLGCWEESVRTTTLKRARPVTWTARAFRPPQRASPCGLSRSRDMAGPAGISSMTPTIQISTAVAM